MKTLSTSPRATALAVTALGALLWSGCSDRTSEPLTGPSTQPRLAQAQSRDVQAAIAAQERHTAALLRVPGVVGTAVGLLPNGRAAVRIFLTSPDVRGLPSALDGTPVAVKVTGQFVAFSDPTTRQRPAPVGFSVGHPDITAGTIGARVVDGSGQVYVLSNNHVLANSNNASLGDPVLQPGPFDGGTASDQVGTLFAFKPIDFSSSGANTIDAAIALSSSADLGNATPADDGYGVPSAAVFGDGNGDGFFDDESALLGLNVQKYGRTTKLTKGQITGINGIVTICYEPFFIFCLLSATFVDQLIVEPGSFSGGGDSGSLLVTDDGGKNPVALLFAGSSTQTITNRIDLVLSHFGVSVDDGASPPPPPPPPPPAKDIAITSVTAPATVTQGDVADVVVTIQNVGTDPVVESFEVTLQDATENIAIGTESVAGLGAGDITTRTFAWATTASSIGSHTLTASHGLVDENGSNDQRSTSTTVNAPSTTIHSGDLDGLASDDGRTWSAIVEITVHDASHKPLSGAAVVGTWSVSGLNANECTTGDLGGDGTCVVLFPGLKKSVKSVTFTVTSVTMPGQAYQQAENHDVDGSSTGTSIRVNKP